MGLRELEKKMKLKEAMRAKAAEYELQELQSKADLTKMTKEKLSDIAKKHGVIIALDDDLRGEVDTIKKQYGIKESNIIREILTEEDVFIKGKKIDHEKLGMLAYQRVILQKDETGGLLILSDVFDLVNTGKLKNRISLTDLEKAVKILKKKKVIPEIRNLEEDVILISFFPVQYTSDQSSILNHVKGKGVTTLAEICANLNWSEERASRALSNLEATGIAKIDESFRAGKKYYFPSLGKK